jgi:hypothetical protein
MEIPDAQGSQAPANGDSTNPVQNQPNPPPPVNGAEARINELTAQMREFQRQASEAQRRNDELTMILVQNAARPQEPIAPAPELPPELQAGFNHYLNPIQKQIQQMQQQFQNQFATMQLQTVTQGQDPRVQKRAAELLQAWSQKGLTGQFTPEDAVRYAKGELFDQLTGQAAAAQQQQQQFNNGSVPLTGHRAPNQNQQQETADPPDIDSWSPEKQAAFYEKKLSGKRF